MPQLETKTDLLPVPLLDFSREYAAIREEVLAAITAVCDSQRFILGPEVVRFEAAAALACAVPHAIGCASGTDALWLSLAALGIGDHETAPTRDPAAVLTTPFSFFATVSSILRAGATPLLTDIDPLTFNISPAATAETLAATSAHGQRVAAVMPVHLFGQCADMTALTALAQQHNFALIEDAAQAFGATWLSQPAGSLGDIAAFSFYPTKNLAAFGDAGLVTTKDATLAERVTMLRAHGMRKRYFHDEVGWNSRLDTLQAAVLEVKLRRVAAGNARRGELACLYHQKFHAAGLAGPTTADGVVLPFADPRGKHVFHQYVIRAPRRDELREYLTAHKIGSEIYYPQPLHLQKSLATLGYKLGDFPIAEQAAHEVLALPIYPDLREAELDSVVEAIRRFYA
jgi:dTDP-4-amino-4,6-dideoxygalactose transaminase